MIFINKFFNFFIYLLIFLVLFICIFFIPFYSDNSPLKILDYIEDGNLLWPAPGIYKINSYFGKRSAPTNGASTYHKGIDIGAPENTEFIAVTNGTITYIGFLGGGGYTITLTDANTENRKNTIFILSL